MTTVSIIGTGAMGTAIGELLGAGGATVHHVGRTHSVTLPGGDGDIVVLAIPYEALTGVVEQYRDELAGRVVVDITNPLDFNTFAELKVAPGSSAAAELQQAVPAAHVVKAFNTNFAATLSSRRVGSAPVTVLVAGDDEAAKKTLVDAVGAAGLSGVDAGGLDRPHELEVIGFLQLTLATVGAIGWSGGFTLIS